MYGDQFGEFVRGSWGLKKGYITLCNLPAYSEESLTFRC